MYIGIYGFEFNEPIRIESAGFNLTPLYSDYKKVKPLARDKKNFNLTGFIEITEEYSLNDKWTNDKWMIDYGEKIWVISSLLTFCQQQWVIVSPRLVEKQEDLHLKLYLPQYRTVGSKLPYSDGLKEKLLNLLYSKLQDNEFIKATDFKTAFYRNVELWRLNQHFEDINYYFCFSGIETLARHSKSPPDYETDAAKVITPFLNSLGFDEGILENLGFKKNIKNGKVNQDEIQDFAHVRNALFHYGAKSKEIKGKKGENRTIYLDGFEDRIMRLFPNVLLKVVGFNEVD